MRSKNVFYALLFLIPVNLGKHFEGAYSYVWGLLVDYLVPTVYLQDLLILLILILWVREKGLPTKEALLSFFNRKEIQLGLLFLFTLFLSVFSSQRVAPSIYQFARIALYFGLFIYSTNEVNLDRDLIDILFILGLSAFFVSILGIIQFIKQSSLFNNYLFFGEQPYSFSTWGVSKENVLGYTLLPSYGLFKHPNVFGGFLSIVTTLMISKAGYYKAFIPLIAASLLGLLFTFSFVSIAAFLLGILFLVLHKRRAFKKFLFVFLIFLFTFSFFLPVLGFKANLPSFYRRANLLQASYKIINEHPLFGVGLNNFPVVIDSYMDYSRDLRFTQPVHNIFVLIFAESGIFAFILFSSFLFLSLRRGLQVQDFLWISVLQVIFLGSFDHYLITAHQTLLLLFVVLSLIFSRLPVDKKL